jgi:hypothetical protein
LWPTDYFQHILHKRNVKRSIVYPGFEPSPPGLRVKHRHTKLPGCSKYNFGIRIPKYEQNRYFNWNYSKNWMSFNNNNILSHTKTTTFVWHWIEYEINRTTRVFNQKRCIQFFLFLSLKRVMQFSMFTRLYFIVSSPFINRLGNIVESVDEKWWKKYQKQ